MSFSGVLLLPSIAALRAFDTTSDRLAMVEELDATYDYPPSWYVFFSGASFTERLPGIVQNNAQTGYWVMWPTPLVLSASDPSGNADLPGIEWVNTTSGDRFASLPDLTWVAIGSGSGSTAATTSTTFDVPAVGSNVTINVSSSASFVAGQYLYIATAGTFEIVTITGPTQIEIQNIGLAGNAAPSTTIAASSRVTATGRPGTIYEFSSDQSLSATLVLTSTDEEIQYAEATGGNQNVTLPAASLADGKTFVVHNYGSTNDLVVGDGTLSVNVTPGSTGRFHSNGAVWRDIS